MTGQRKTELSFLALAASLSTAPALAQPAEPLVETRLTDPDPGFVPPPPEKATARTSQHSHQDPTLDQAFENLGRIAGQAAQMAQQRADSRSAELQARARDAIDRVRADSDRLSRIACASVDSARKAGIDVSSWEKDCPR